MMLPLTVGHGPAGEPVDSEHYANVVCAPLPIRSVDRARGYLSAPRGEGDQVRLADVDPGRGRAVGDLASNADDGSFAAASPVLVPWTRTGARSGRTDGEIMVGEGSAGRVVFECERFGGR